MKTVVARYNRNRTKIPTKHKTQNTNQKTKQTAAAEDEERLGWRVECNDSSHHVSMSCSLANRKKTCSRVDWLSAYSLMAKRSLLPSSAENTCRRVQPMQAQTGSQIEPVSKLPPPHSRLPLHGFTYRYIDKKRETKKEFGV